MSLLGKIVIYYKYIHIADTGSLRAWQRKLCTSLNLRGRVIIANEGVNGTIGGSPQAVNSYVSAMQQHPLFSDVDFKESEGGDWSFPRMRVVIRKQIVHWGSQGAELDPQKRGVHLEPSEVHELLNENPKDLLLLDTRNLYESRIGTFRNALKAPIERFRDLPEYIDTHLDTFKDKKVLMFCTAGVRCEPASAYLKSKGVAQEVYQIKGGIHRYVEEYPDGHFRGKNYVFDGRCSVRVNQDVLTHCDLCSTSCDEYLNCANAECNEQFIACPSCAQRLKETCSQKCYDLVEQGVVVRRLIPAKTFPPSHSVSSPS